MSKTYSFKCIDHDTTTVTTVKFNTDSDTWSGYDGPMWKFYDFLKGCGFVFDTDMDIGIINRVDGDSSFAVDDE